MGLKKVTQILRKTLHFEAVSNYLEQKRKKTVIAG